MCLISIWMLFKKIIYWAMHIFRGMAYFDLVRFGVMYLWCSKIPAIRIFSQNGLLQISFMTRLSKYLKFAEANCLHLHELPASEIGRVTSEAASSMLSRVFLQRSGTSLALPTDNQSALDECNKVISYSASHPDVLTLVRVTRIFLMLQRKTVRNVYLAYSLESLLLPPIISLICLPRQV